MFCGVLIYILTFQFDILISIYLDAVRVGLLAARKQKRKKKVENLDCNTIDSRNTITSSSKIHRLSVLSGEVDIFSVGDGLTVKGISAFGSVRGQAGDLSKSKWYYEVTIKT